MKVFNLILIFISVIILSIPANAVWYDSSFGYRTTVNISNGSRPAQISLNLSNSIGTNNATHVFCNGHCNTNFTDIRFTLNNATLLPYWIEDNSTGKIWVNVTANGTVNMYYGKLGVSSSSNGNQTFTFFDNFTYDLSRWIVTESSAGNVQIVSGETRLTGNTAWNTNGMLSTSSFTKPFILEYKHREGGTLGWGASGLTTGGFPEFAGTVGIWDRFSDAGAYSIIRDIATLEYTGTYSAGTQYKTKIVNRNDGHDVYRDDIQLVNSAVVNTASRIAINQYSSGTYQYVDDVRIRTYPELPWSTWGSQEGFLINNVYNNFTGDNTLNFTLTETTNILFNVSNTSSADYFAWYLNGVNQSTNSNSTTLTITLAGNNNVTIIAFNSSESVASTVSWFIMLPFTLLTPANGSTLTSLYPPLDTPINFSWSSVGFPYYELVISRTPDFSMIVSDTYVTVSHKTVSLAGGSYWWKVRNYDAISETWGAYSGTFNFTLTITSAATGQGVDGVVYELIGGVYTPIDQATVYIYNTTWSSLIVTGTNGYYLFTPLANGTYNIYASKNGYDTTVVFPATVNGSITTNDILMKIFISPYIPNFVFEKFIVRDLFDRSYVGVTVTVFKGDSPVSSFTGTTDSAGQAVFQLIKDQRYRITFTGGGISGTITIYVYAKEESYFVRVLSGFPTGGDRYADINTSLTAISINATHSYLQLVYNDTKASTSLINFYATNISTNTTCTNSSVSNVVTLTCTVMASGTYQFGFNATSSIYGFFQEDKVINFDAGKPTTPTVITNVDKTLLQWASIILIVLTAALFSIRTVKYGAVIVPLEALALWVFGWFEPIVNNMIGSFLLLSCAVVLGVMIYLRGSEVKVNF